MMNERVRKICVVLKKSSVCVVDSEQECEQVILRVVQDVQSHFDAIPHLVVKRLENSFQREITEALAVSLEVVSPEIHNHLLTVNEGFISEIGECLSILDEENKKILLVIEGIDYLQDENILDNLRFMSQTYKSLIILASSKDVLTKVFPGSQIWSAFMPNPM
jgi:hypothetical protein